MQPTGIQKQQTVCCFYPILIHSRRFVKVLITVKSNTYTRNTSIRSIREISRCADIPGCLFLYMILALLVIATAMSRFPSMLKIRSCPDSAGKVSRRVYSAYRSQTEPDVRSPIRNRSEALCHSDECQDTTTCPSSGYPIPRCDS